MIHRNDPKCPSVDHLQARFLSIMPRITRHGQIHFRHLQPVQREEVITEMVAISWKWFRRLAERGKDAAQFPTVLASLAARAVSNGRRLCGQEKAKDVMSSLAQRRHGFRVERLPSSTSQPYEDVYGSPRGQQNMDAYEERLHDNTQTPVPDQVQFRIDFPAWLTTRTERDRRMIDEMSLNHRTKDLASSFGICPARISQLRQEYHADWRQFLGDPTNTNSQPVAAVA